VDALIVANALGGNLSAQNHLGALVADYAGMPGVEALRVEAADASGGLRCARRADGRGRAAETSWCSASRRRPTAPQRA